MYLSGSLASKSSEKASSSVSSDFEFLTAEVECLRLQGKTLWCSTSLIHSMHWLSDELWSRGNYDKTRTCSWIGQMWSLLGDLYKLYIETSLGHSLIIICIKRGFGSNFNSLHLGLRSDPLRKAMTTLSPESGEVDDAPLIWNPGYATTSHHVHPRNLLLTRRQFRCVLLFWLRYVILW